MTTLLLALGIAVLAAGAPALASAEGRQRGPRPATREAPEPPDRVSRERPSEDRGAVTRRPRDTNPERRRMRPERGRATREAERAENRQRLPRRPEAREPSRTPPRELPEEPRGMPAEGREPEREEFRRRPLDRPARSQPVIQRWDELTPQQRKEVSEHVQRLRRFSEEQRERIERNRPTWEHMDPTDRERMRHRLESFRSLPPAQQEALVDRRFPDRTPEQRARILDRLRAR